MSGGFVSLVGAGPGDPELLTLKAVRRLAEADLVLTDALVPGDLAALAPRARRFFVGKRAGRPSIDQETIHRLMIRAARRGQRVVRLKGGDPFVFGRGGEEVLALRAAGIPYEVIPGISSSIAAPAMAEIPVTHRGLVSGYVVVSGHAEAAYRPILSGVAPGTATVVVLMGVRTRAAIAALLLARGFAPGTPAAVVLGAFTPEAETWTGTLAQLPAAPVDGDRPGTIVIGEVVSLAAAAAAAREVRHG
ncbi:MAG TPA: uroporphyrinogen-III C-methyltransferase [Haliangiales bacterium]|nr:uroporphyrinogen-III C-methyltransferase [Haliangiales bacterium]